VWWRCWHIDLICISPFQVSHRLLPHHTARILRWIYLDQMVNFGKAIRVQSNPAWVNEYVQYRRLKTIIKRLVYLWNHGNLRDVPIHYDPTNPTITYSGKDLIPPKMPRDESDDEEEVDDNVHVSVASISVHPTEGVFALDAQASHPSSSESRSGKDQIQKQQQRQRERDELAQSVRELAALEANERWQEQRRLDQQQQQQQQQQHHDVLLQLDKPNHVTSATTPLLFQTKSNDAETMSSTSSGRSYGAMEALHLSPTEGLQLRASVQQQQFESQQQHPQTQQPPRGLRQVLSFGTFKSLFASSPTPAGTPVPGTPVDSAAGSPQATPDAAAPEMSRTARKQQQAKLLFEEYQRDFWTILEGDLQRVEQFYESMVSRSTVRVRQMVEDAVGSYRHRAPNLEAAANAGLTRDEARFGAILAEYEELIDLKAYCQLNVQGFRKILKKYAKYSPKYRRDIGQLVSVTAVPCDKFMQRVYKSSFAMMEDLQLLIQQISNLVARDKLVAIELQVQAKRAGIQSELAVASSGGSLRFGACKIIPFTIALCLFLLILILPLNLDPNQYQLDVGDLPGHEGGIAVAPQPTETQPLNGEGSDQSAMMGGDSAADKAARKARRKAPFEGHSEAGSAEAVSPAIAPETPVPDLPLHSHDNKLGHRTHLCFAILIFAITLWVTEAIPYFCTGMLIPILVVVLDVAVDMNSGTPHELTPKQAANYVASHMFDRTSLLVLLSFAISAAFSKAQLELRIASKFQAKLGSKPRLFILGIMVLGLVLSMWLGNHTAPILCVAFLLPVMQDYPHDSKFNRALMLGLTFASNIGGMTTPIASLQNIVAVATLSKVGIDISFGQWLVVSVPLCVLLVVLCWVFIMFTIDPDDVDSIPLIAYDKKPLSAVHWIVIVLSGVTVLLLAFPSLSESTLGGIPTISLIYLVTIFSTGILTTVDINSFNWHLILLIGGGSVLGDVIKSSKLLDVLCSVILQALSKSPFIAYFQIVFVIIVITSCISHTVGALILTPLIVRLGLSLGVPVTLTLTCAFAISGAMALPFSSFPNLNAALARDESGNQYLDPKTIMRAGIPFTLVTYVVLVTFGYVLIRFTIGA